jgi:hypothetical protein
MARSAFARGRIAIAAGGRALRGINVRFIPEGGHRRGRPRHATQMKLTVLIRRSVTLRT